MSVVATANKSSCTMGICRTIARQGFYQPAARLVIRSLYVFRVCLFVCLSLCASALNATAVYSSFWRFVGQATANEGSFVLPVFCDRGFLAYSY